MRGHSIEYQYSDYNNKWFYINKSNDYIDIGKLSLWNFVQQSTHTLGTKSNWFVVYMNSCSEWLAKLVGFNGT